MCVEREKNLFFLWDTQYWLPTLPGNSIICIMYICTRTLGWTNFGLFAIFEIQHLALDSVSLKKMLSKTKIDFGLKQFLYLFLI